MEKYELRRIDDDTVKYYLNNVKVFEHYKDSNGHETWIEYDESGNEIHTKDSNGYETWIEYDENGNEIHYKNSDGDESWKEYDENGNEIHYKNKEPFTF